MIDHLFQPDQRMVAMHKYNISNKKLVEFNQILREMIYNYIQDYRGRSAQAAHTPVGNAIPNRNDYKTVLDMGFSKPRDMLALSNFGISKLVCSTSSPDIANQFIRTKNNPEYRNIRKPFLEILFTNDQEDIQ